MHPNGELIREGYEAFAKGDMDTISRLFDDDIQWHAAGVGPLSGDYSGKAAVFGFFGDFIERTDYFFHQEIHAILADEVSHALGADAGVNARVFVQRRAADNPV